MIMTLFFTVQNVSFTKAIEKLENVHLTGNEIKPAVQEVNTTEKSVIGSSDDTGNIKKTDLHARERVVDITGDTQGIKPKNESDVVSASIDRSQDNAEGDKSKTDLSAKTGRIYKKPNEGNLKNIKENAETHEIDQQKFESLDSEIDSESDESERKIGHAASKCDNTDSVTEKSIKKRKKNKKTRKKDRDAKNIQEDSLQTKKGENGSTITISKRNNTDINSEAEQQNRNVKDKEFAAPETTKEDKSEKKDGNSGQVFGIAKSWETSQSTPNTVIETAFRESTLFASSTANSSSNQLASSDDIKAMEGTKDDTKTVHEGNTDEDMSN